MFDSQQVLRKEKKNNNKENNFLMFGFIKENQILLKLFRNLYIFEVT